MSIRHRSEALFHTSIWSITGIYALLILLILWAMFAYTSPSDCVQAMRQPEILHSIYLSLVTSTLSAVLSIWVAVPAGYVLARTRFKGKGLIEILFDIPIILPPLVVGLGLLMLFQSDAGKLFQTHVFSVTYGVVAIVIAQATVACSFAVKTMKTAFEQSDPKAEQVAQTLGATRSQAFIRVALPEVRRGALTAFTLAWARSLGEFGPVLVFAGATRMKTEVLPTTIFLELSVGNLEAAIAVSLLMVGMACSILLISRLCLLPKEAR